MDDLDGRILQALQEDGRIPFTQIARQAGVSETTIRTRYRDLVRAGIVRTKGILDPRALGYEVLAIVAISVAPGMAEQVAKTIAQLPEVSNLVTTLGSYDMIIEVFCQDVPHLTELVTQQIHPILGVRASETLMIADYYKERCLWSPGFDFGPEAE